MQKGESKCSVETLNLSDNEIDSAATTIAAHVLGKPNNKMLSLDLSWNNIRGRHAVHIGERLAGRGPAYKRPRWRGPTMLGEAVPKAPQTRRHYDWSMVDTSDLLKEQDHLRKVRPFK